jgi:hypothetical protein
VEQRAATVPAAPEVGLTLFRFVLGHFCNFQFV